MADQNTKPHMKLIHITMHYFPIFGGQEIYIHSLNQLLCHHGIDVSVIQPARHTDLNKPDYVHYVPRLRFFGRFMKGLDWLWFNTLLSTRKRFLKMQDVLVSHYPFHYPAIRWHKHVIVVSHGVDWSEPPTLLFDKYKKYAALMAKNKNAKIIANDTSFLRAIGIDAKPGEGYFREISKQVWFIPNCVDTDKFYPKNTKRENVILVPRNIRKSRGIHLAIEAFALFFKNHNEYSMKIAGGPLTGQYYEYCLDLVKQHSLENSIQFVGNLQNDTLPDLYNASKITLIPTIAFEGTSISALESMSCKTPVVSTDTGGLADLPSYKVKISSKDIYEGLECVLNSWQDESNRQYQHIINTFNMSNWKNAWLKVIQN